MAWSSRCTKIYGENSTAVVDSAEYGQFCSRDYREAKKYQFIQSAGHNHTAWHACSGIMFLVYVVKQWRKTAEKKVNSANAFYKKGRNFRNSRRQYCICWKRLQTPPRMWRILPAMKLYLSAPLFERGNNSRQI
eukprot:scaffold3508_cov113-Cylindrotheca_fusiformis.AAC.7